MPRQFSPADLETLDAHRICLIKPSALGDVVQTLPVLAALRERFPQASISWVVHRGLADLLDGHPALNEIIPFDRHGSWRDWRALLGRLRQSQFDLVFDLQGLLRTGVMTWATRAPVRVGLETAREGAHLACNCLLPDTGRQVAAHRRYWRVAEAVGMGHLRPETTVALSSEDRLWAARQLKTLRPPLLAVQPGARWETKRYPVEKFAAVVAKAVRVYGFSVAILGSRDEAPLASRLEHLLKRRTPAVRVANFAGKTTLKQLAALLSEATCVLTNDSGPMHLAAGLGTPLVGVFTCTSPMRSGPSGEAHELITADVPCAASYKKSCPHSGSAHMACMHDLESVHVWRALVRLIEKNAVVRRAA
jgi:lipopolysaccharide heptosyltransferase I